MKNYVVKEYHWVDLGGGYGYWEYEFEIINT